MNDNFDLLLDKARIFHGEVCAGIVLGVRITMAGMQALGMDPMQRNRDLLVFVEIDRCMTDAVQAITGCSLGRRTLKYHDYGRFAATFHDMAGRRSIRVASRQQTSLDRKVDLREVYKTIPQDELLVLQEVVLNIDEGQLPGFPKVVEQCGRCKEMVFDDRHVVRNGQVLCRVCSGQSCCYYGPAGEIDGTTPT